MPDPRFPMVESLAPRDQGSAAASAAQQPAEPAEPSDVRHGGTASVGLSDEVTVEEGSGAYKPGHFHPVYIGDIFNERYLVLNKLRYGLYSTVWLTNDFLLPREDEGNAYYALKVLSAECYGTDKDIFEREILRHLRDADKTHVGYKYICHLVDDFEHRGPNGTHVIINQNTSRLTSDLDANSFSNQDIKPDNIFVKVRDKSLIESQYLKQVPAPIQERLAGKYLPIPSQPLKRFYFIPDQSFLDFEVAIGDWGVSLWADNHLTELIQPVALRAPEVLIKAPWDATTDWWNLGAMILEVFRCVRMFDGRGPPHGHYELKQHLREIVAYFGPFPKGLLEKGDAEPVETYFDESGHVLGCPALELPSLESDDYMDDLDEENRKSFVSFLYALMKIDPKERLSTMDLLRHPWLGIVGLRS
ncbi:serine/threonine protein kinase [Seiridium cupressi]